MTTLLTFRSGRATTWRHALAAASFVIVISSVSLALVASIASPHPTRAQTTAAVDQEQTQINSAVGVLAIGGGSDQKLAQVITAGMSGGLTEVRLAVSCTDADLVLQIQTAGAGASMSPAGLVGPTGVVLGSQTYPGAALSGATGSLRSLPLTTPVQLTAGSTYAIVLQAANQTSTFGSCASYQAPAGDTYAGGNMFFIAAPNSPTVWVCNCEFGPTYPLDLPFQTVVDASLAPAPTETPTTVPSATPTIAPTATRTPVPTATPKPSASPTTTPSAQNHIDQLRAAVRAASAAGTLNAGVASALVQKLDAATASLSRGAAGATTACYQLNAFARQLIALPRGIMSPAAKQGLLAETERTMRLLACR